jgi:hypothetical protein
MYSSKCDRQTLIKEAMIRMAKKTQITSKSQAGGRNHRRPARRLRSKCDDWLVSNPEGYANGSSLECGCKNYLPERAGMVKGRRIDDLQYKQWKTPLQCASQLLNATAIQIQGRS